MPVELRMLQMDQTMTKGKIGKWLVSEGDTVTEGQPLLEIETDKVVHEHESPADGIVAQLCAEEGSMVHPLPIFYRLCHNISITRPYYLCKEILMQTTVCFLLTFLLFSVAAAQETDTDELLLSDVNQDGIVNILDLTYVASQFGEIPTKDQLPNPDINRDGVINILDLTLVASHFGKYSGIPIRLTDKTFDNVVLKAELPILVEFKSDY